MQVIHQFSIQLSKFVFLDGSGHIVVMRDGVRADDAIASGLTPLLLYGLAVEGLPIRYGRTAPLASPMPYRRFLREAWLANPQGLPDVLKIGARFLDSLLGLSDLTDHLGITLAVAAGNDRSYNANQFVLNDSLQNAAYSALWACERRGNPTASPRAEDMFKDDPSGYVNWGRGLWGVEPPAVVARYREYLARQPRQAPSPPDLELPVDPDFTPGAWLYGNQKSLPPRTPREVRALIYRKPAADDAIDEAAETDSEDTDLDSDSPDLDDDEGKTSWAHEEMATLAKCWPVPLSQLAKAAGARTQELKWFLQGREALPYDAHQQLQVEMGVFESERFYYEDDGSAAPSIEGDFVLTAPADQANALRRVFDELAHGGDQEFSYEFIPEHGRADPSYRFLVMECDGLHIIAVPRGGKSAALLDNGGLINFGGLLSVDPALYADVVKVWVQTTQGKLAPSSAGEALIPRWSRELGELSTRRW